MSRWLLAGMLLFQVGDPAPLPAPANARKLVDWVVIVELPSRMERGNLTPLLNMRVVLKADSEGDAVFKATAFIQAHTLNTDFPDLKFMEVGRIDPIPTPPKKP